MENILVEFTKPHIMSGSAYLPRERRFVWKALCDLLIKQGVAVVVESK